MPQVAADGVLREGKNIGLNEACSSVISICHGTSISNALNTVPGFNAFATLHDTWMSTPNIMNTVTNIGTMLPALLINYGSILDQYYYINQQKGK